MARSNETFHKKENEKKRLKKQQEKKEKAAERKANSAKGKGLEDMMAYLDENGDLTAVRPLQSGQKLVSAADIAIAIPKRLAETEEPLKTGEIIFFNSAKGYGFIKIAATQETIFFHVDNLQYPAKEHDQVNFSTARGPKGLTALHIVKGD